MSRTFTSEELPFVKFQARQARDQMLFAWVTARRLQGGKVIAAIADFAAYFDLDETSKSLANSYYRMCECHLGGGCDGRGE